MVGDGMLTRLIDHLGGSSSSDLDVEGRVVTRPPKVRPRLGWSSSCDLDVEDKVVVEPLVEIFSMSSSVLDVPANFLKTPFVKSITFNWIVVSQLVL
ncbi:hypothetical protein ACLB2K_046886 [Fragaria x ananassa]